MRAREILDEALGEMLAEMDPRLVRGVFDAVESLLKCQRLTLTDLGRSLPRDCGRKHAVKCVDRLLKNPRIEASRGRWGKALGSALFGRNSNPLLLVDWTETGPGFWTLSVATPIGGRAVALYHEVHPTAKLSNPKVEREFIHTLKEEVIPVGCTPVVVTDSGFGTPWFQVVQGVGWDYVGRLGGGMHVCPESADPADLSGWERLSVVYQKANSRPQDLREYYLTRSHQFSSRLVLHKRRSKGRKASRKPNRKGVHPGSHAVKTARKRAKEPWLLATSMSAADTSTVLDCYGRRFQIEETFRDTKSHRYGWSFEDAGSHTKRRLNNLLLIAILGAYVTLAHGIAAEDVGLQKGLQANTMRRRRVFSLFFLGRMVLSDSRLLAIVQTRLREALQALRLLVQRTSSDLGFSAFGKAAL